MIRRRDSGMATAELALALPLVVLLVLFGVGLVGAVRSGVECQNAARLAARLAGRGGGPAAVREAAIAAAPSGAVVTIGSEQMVGGRTAVTVEVAVRVSLTGPWSGPAPRVRVLGRAAALVEPDIAVDPGPTSDGAA